MDKGKLAKVIGCTVLGVLLCVELAFCQTVFSDNDRYCAKLLEEVESAEAECTQDGHSKNYCHHIFAAARKTCKTRD